MMHSVLIFKQKNNQVCFGCMTYDFMFVKVNNLSNIPYVWKVGLFVSFSADKTFQTFILLGLIKV